MKTRMSLLERGSIAFKLQQQLFPMPLAAPSVPDEMMRAAVTGMYAFERILTFFRQPYINAAGTSVQSVTDIVIEMIGKDLRPGFAKPDLIARLVADTMNHTALEQEITLIDLLVTQMEAAGMLGDEDTLNAFWHELVYELNREIAFEYAKVLGL